MFIVCCVLIVGVVVVEGTLRSSVLLNGLGLVAVVVDLFHVAVVDDVEGGGQDLFRIDEG